MANVNVIQKTISGTPTDFYYEDTAGRNLTAEEQDLTLVATKSYVVDDLFWYDDKLYRITTPVSSGDTIVITGGTPDAVQTTVSDELKRRGLASDKQDKNITAMSIEGHSESTVVDALGALNTYKAGLADLAPEFDDTQSYLKNDCVVYNGDVYRFKVNHSGAWVAADADHITVTEAGGHAMITATEDDTDVNTIANLTFADASDEKVANAYTLKKYSNCDATLVLTPVAQGTDTVGTWLDTNWQAGTRSGWLWSEEFYQILSDGASPTPNNNYNVEVIPVFDIANSEVVSLYGYRVDDDYPIYTAVSSPSGNPQAQGWYESDGATPPSYTLTSDTVVQAGKTYYTKTNGGCVAFKFNNTIRSASGVKVGLKLVYQRTNVLIVNSRLS